MHVLKRGEVIAMSLPRSLSVLMLVMVLWTPAFGANPLKVTFVNPSHPGPGFWGTVTAFMQAAADDLDIDLKVVYASKSSDIDRLEYVRLFEQEANAPDKPDFIITHFRKATARTILDIAEKSQVKTFIFNTSVPTDERKVVGFPRGQYKYWVGHMYPDDVRGGFDLATALIDAAQKKGLAAENGKIGVVGISGNQHSVAALSRNRGLEQAVKDSEARLHQIVFAKWKKPIAEDLSTKLIQRFPDISVIWAASDLMSLGVVEAAEKVGKAPGQQVLTGGFDWRSDALEAIKAGTMTASAGGHFMEGGWAMVMLYDYANGKDFAADSARVESHLKIIDGTNVDAYLSHFSDRDWNQIDFREFSKVYDPKVKEYDFSLSAIFKQLKE